MDILTFGFKRPDTGDKGSALFTALEDNITRLDAHDHDGTDSDRIDGFDLRRGSISVTNSGWSASGAYYKKTITLPAGYSSANGSDYTKAQIRFFFSGGTYDKQELFPKTNYLTATTFELFSIANNQAFTITLV